MRLTFLTAVGRETPKWVLEDDWNVDAQPGHEGATTVPSGKVGRELGHILERQHSMLCCGLLTPLLIAKRKNCHL